MQNNTYPFDKFMTSFMYLYSRGWKPDRESALRMYEYFKEQNAIPKEIEDRVRQDVSDETAARLFILKEILDIILKDMKSQN